MKTKTLIQICLFFAAVGVALSTYSYLHNRSFVEGTFCNLNSTFSCDVVNKGPYSTLLGIPVALIGIIGYGFLLVGAFLKYRQPADKAITLFLVLASAGAIAFSLYLTALEAFVLRVWCIVCLVSQFSIIAFHAAAVSVYQRERKLPPPSNPATPSAPQAL